MRKLTGNYQKDYYTGVADGKKEGLRDMFLTHTYILLPAMYNAKDDDIITDRYFGEYAKKVEKEIQRIIDEVFDVENVISRRIKKKTWKKDLSEATIFKYYDKDDTVPYEMVKKRKTKQIVRDIVLKRFRLYIVFVLDKMGFRK